MNSPTIAEILDYANLQMAAEGFLFNFGADASKQATQEG